MINPRNYFQINRCEYTAMRTQRLLTINRIGRKVYREIYL